MGHYQNGYSREAIKYGSAKKRMLNNEITQLEKIIDELQTELNEKTINENSILELNSNKDKLNKLIESKTQDAIIRSRVKWYEEGEKTLNISLTLKNIILI